MGYSDLKISALKRRLLFVIFTLLLEPLSAQKLGKEEAAISASSFTGADVIITSGATLALVGSVQLALDGDWSNNGDLSADNASTVIFSCPSARTFTGATLFGSVVKIGDGSLLLNGNMSIASALDLQDGVIITDTNKVVFLASATVLSGSDSSYVNGFVQHHFDSKPSSKIFPFGSGGRYRGLNLNGSSAMAASLLGALVEANPSSLASLPGGLEKVSTIRYYDFFSGADTLNLFSIDAFNVNADDEAGSFVANTSLRLATLKDSDVTWTAQSLVTAPNTTNFPVQIESNSFSISLSPSTHFYTALATTSQLDNPLPVWLKRFIGEASIKSVHLKWSTISEVENVGFILLRSNDSLSYQEIASFQNFPALQGGGTSTIERQYEFVDHRVNQQQTYVYKLRSVDYSGIIHDYAPIVSVGLSSAKPLRYELLQNYPNPFNPTTIIQYELKFDGNVRLELYDVLGRKVATLVHENEAAGSHQVVLSASSLGLSSGVYFYRLEAGSATNDAPLFVQTKRMMLIK
jgi:hypothetical protein